jgi:predicted nucleotidyltransferase
MIKELWEEYMRENEIDLQSLVPQDNLQPSFWNKDLELKKSVADKLMEISKDFLESINLDDSVELKDVTITGSIASFNWSKYSDIDLHLMVDYKDVDENEDLVKEYFAGKIFVWNTKHEIMMNDHEVEIYVQNESEPHISGGIYSVMHDKWLQKPKKEDVIINLESVEKKVLGLVDQIERSFDLFEQKNYKPAMTAAKSIKEKIKLMRRSGLSREGIYSVENLAFKVLRRSNHLGLINDIIDQSYDRIMSLHKDLRGTIKVFMNSDTDTTEEHYSSLNEEESFQRRVKQRHYLQKKRLIGLGGEKNSSPYIKKPSYKRSKSAPAGFGGS